LGALMDDKPDILQELSKRFGDEAVMAVQETRDHIPTAWITADHVHEILRYLKLEVDRPYRMLYDLTAIDERTRANRRGQPASTFTVVYQLLSFGRNAYILWDGQRRLKSYAQSKRALVSKLLKAAAGRRHAKPWPFLPPLLFPRYGVRGTAGMACTVPEPDMHRVSTSASAEQALGTRLVFSPERLPLNKRCGEQLSAPGGPATPNRRPGCALTSKAVRLPAFRGGSL
jgi:hypothetical protein